LPAGYVAGDDLHIYICRSDRAEFLLLKVR